MKDKYIPTNINDIDKFFEGGLPRGKVIEVNGGKDSGKTSLILKIIEGIQKRDRGYFIVIIDIENKVDRNRARSLGVDTDTILIVTPMDLEELMEMIEFYIKSDFTDLVIIDSIETVINKSYYEYNCCMNIKLLSNMLKNLHNKKICCSIIIVKSLKGIEENAILLTSRGIIRVKDIEVGYRLRDNKNKSSFLITNKVNLGNSKCRTLITKEGKLIIGEDQLQPVIEKDNGLKYYKKVTDIEIGDYLIRPLGFHNMSNIYIDTESCSWGTLYGADFILKKDLLKKFRNLFTKDKDICDMYFSNYMSNEEEILDIIKRIRGAKVQDKIQFIRGIYLFRRLISDDQFDRQRGIRLLDGDIYIVEYISCILHELDICFEIDYKELKDNTSILWIPLWYLNDFYEKIKSDINKLTDLPILHYYDNNNISVYLLRRLLLEQRYVLNGITSAYINRKSLLKILHNSNIYRKEDIIDFFKFNRFIRILNIKDEYYPTYSLEIDKLEDEREEKNSYNIYNYNNLEGIYITNGFLTNDINFNLSRFIDISPYSRILIDSNYQKGNILKCKLYYDTHKRREKCMDIYIDI